MREEPYDRRAGRDDENRRLFPGGAPAARDPWRQGPWDRGPYQQPPQQQQQPQPRPWGGFFDNFRRF
jgi:hypothetical protein